MDPLVRNIQLAERFGKTPLEIEDDDTDRWLIYIQAMGVEGIFREMAQGAPEDEPIVREGDV